MAVGQPVPPCQTEIVPPRPRGEAVWIDGEWSWSGSAWAWVHGRWVIAPPGAKFSPWTTARDGQGNVYFASGAWFDVNGKTVAAPAPLASGRSPMHLITSPDGDDEKTAPPVDAPQNAAPSLDAPQKAAPRADAPKPAAP